MVARARGPRRANASTTVASTPRSAHQVTARMIWIVGWRTAPGADGFGPLTRSRRCSLLVAVRGLGLAVLLAACGADAPGDPVGGTTGTTTAGASTSAEVGSEAEGSSEGTTGEVSDESSTGEVPDDPGDPWDPVPDWDPLSEDGVAGLQATLDAILADGSVSGATQGVLIVDLETDQVLYERNADDVLVPASNAKMLTTASTIDILGEDHRMLTEIVADAAPDGAGVVNGDLHLVGDHDFTWSTFFYDSARTPLDRIAEQLYADGVRQVTGSAVARGEFCYEGYSLGTYDAIAHRSTAAVRFGEALAAAGITVNGGTASSPDFDPPGGGTSLLTWASPPLHSAAVHVNGPSHNEFADILLRHLGWHVAGQSTYTAGGDQMRQWMDSLPTETEGVEWHDGSGLSHSNRASARNLVDLLRFATTGPGGEAWLRSQAIAGVRGTIEFRMTGPDTWGHVWGKTGTLPSIGVVTLSGVLYHRYDGRRYAFSILFNGVASVDGARGVQNQVVEALAADLRATGARPASPELQAMVNEPDSTVIGVRWSEVPDADGYALWLSPDGKAFAFEDARYVQGTEYRMGELPFSPTYVRVTAVAEVGGGPVHSVASDVYGAEGAFEASTVLVVDGNDRWQAEPVGENPRRIGHDFVAVTGAALGAGFDAAANDEVIAGTVALSDYDVVVWSLGEESDVDRTFDEVEQSVVAEYLGAGGALFVSGAELGYDLAGVGTPEDAAFLADVLHAGYVGDDAASWVASDGSGPFEGLPTLQFNTFGDQVVGFPDQLAAAGSSAEVLRYRGGAGGTAAVAVNTDTRVIVLGFPFESIDNADDRADVMDRALEFLR